VSGRIWHDRPIVAPVIYSLSALVAGVLAFSFGYLLTDDLGNALYCLVFTDALLVWFLLESRRSARERNRGW